jgi:nucleotide-binding universal stress UspA family protein
MKDVLALLSPTPGDQLSAGAHYALGLARAHGALLSALIAEIEAYSPNLPPEPDNVQADNATIELSSSTEQLARTAALVLSAAKLANVSCEILAAGNQVVSLRERVIDCAQVRDALIVDVYGPLQSPRKDLVDGNLFGSGRPVVLVPQSTRAFAQDRILLAWDATRSAVRAVHDALPLLIRARDVTIVSVIDDKTFSTSDSGDALCDYLARWNVDAKFSAINRETTNIGTTLLAYAQRTEADLLVMGGFAHGMERALMLGSATQDVFRTSLEIPVFLSH